MYLFCRSNKLCIQYKLQGPELGICYKESPGQGIPGPVAVTLWPVLVVTYCAILDSRCVTLITFGDLLLNLPCAFYRQRVWAWGESPATLPQESN